MSLYETTITGTESQQEITFAVCAWINDFAKKIYDEQGIEFKAGGDVLLGETRFICTESYIDKYGAHCLRFTPEENADYEKLKSFLAPSA